MNDRSCATSRRNCKHIVMKNADPPFLSYNRLLVILRSDHHSPASLVSYINLLFAFGPDVQTLIANIPSANDFPFVSLFMQESSDSLYATLDWQKNCARVLIKHYLNHVMSLQILKEQCRYLHLPIGNIPADPTLFGADIFYARHLLKNNFVLWVSETEKPDLGGREADDNR